ncbi:MAG: hypothetical protein IJW89_04930, partial [Clostridia bacterium]|nr:hypothetical protein [Clostridia bacterium]
MNNRQLESKIRTSFAHACPPVEGEFDTVKPVSVRRPQWKRMLAAAAAFLFVVGAALALPLLQPPAAAETTVTLDINPCIELKVDGTDTV